MFEVKCDYHGNSFGAVISQCRPSALLDVFIAQQSCTDAGLMNVSPGRSQAATLL